MPSAVKRWYWFLKDFDGGCGERVSRYFKLKEVKGSPNFGLKFLKISLNISILLDLNNYKHIALYLVKYYLILSHEGTTDKRHRFFGGRGVLLSIVRKTLVDCFFAEIIAWFQTGKKQSRLALQGQAMAGENLSLPTAFHRKRQTLGISLSYL